MTRRLLLSTFLCLLVAAAAAAQPPDLIVTKDDGGVVATPGDTVIYAITVENAGGTATGVLLRDVAPANVTFNAAVSDPAWSCSNPLVSCFLSLAAVAGGAPAQTFLIGFDVDSPLPVAAQAIRNISLVGDDGSSGLDLDPSNNFAFDVTPFSPETGPDLVVTKTDGGALAGAGDVVVYTITVSNEGTQDTGGVVLTDAVPADTSFSAAGSDPGWSCSAASCSLAVGFVGVLDAPRSFDIAFVVDLPLAAGVTEVSNTVVATDDGASEPDLDPSSNTATETTPIDSPATGIDLRLTKDDGVASVGAGQTVVYTLSVDNVGTQDAAGVVLSDAVPAETSFDPSASSAGWSCSGGTCSLAAGTVRVVEPPRVLTIAFRVDSPLAAGVTAITNSAMVTDDGTVGPDLVIADNVASEVTPIDFGGGTGPDLVLSKDDGGATADAGGSVSYTLTVSNTGTQDAAGVMITDAVPANATFSAAGSSPGWSCAADTCTLLVGDVAAGAPPQRPVIAFDVISPVGAGITAITNTATVSDDGTGGVDLDLADHPFSF